MYKNILVFRKDSCMCLYTSVCVQTEGEHKRETKKNEKANLATQIINIQGIWVKGIWESEIMSKKSFKSFSSLN